MNVGYQKESFSSGSFYDFEKIKQIPIANVCIDMLGLPCEKRNGNLWCKSRNESDASTILHEDKNTFYDFGTHEHGDIIHFVSYVLNISQKEAVRRLADSFHIAPENRREGLSPNDLADWEYKKIGLYGDKATKNFDFYFDRMPVERIATLSEKYAMPMSTLRKKHPKTYERILRQRALPFVKSLRNDYFLDVWQKYAALSSYGYPEMFYDHSTQNEFKEQIKELERAENILSRAIAGTGITYEKGRGYDPVKDLQKLSSGKLKPILGTANHSALREEAIRRKTNLRYQVVDYLSYVTSDLDQYFHSAFLDSGRVIVGYLQADYGKIKNTLNALKKTKIRKIPSKNEMNRSSGHKPDLER